MTARDMNASDMLGAFDFTQKPRAPIVIAPDGTTPYPAPLQKISN
jgi:hypothetical protein